MRFGNALERLAKSGMRVFTVYDVAKIIGKSTSYASLMLSKSGRVSRIERGKYFIEGASKYEIASNIVFPSYVSLQAALQYYGLIDQNIVKYSVISPKRHKPVIAEGMSIEFIKAQRRIFFGYLNKAGAYVASPEKLFVDCLYFGRVPFSILKEALNSANEEHLVDAGLIVEYAVKTERDVLINRLGFLLECCGMSADGLLRYRYHNYVRISDTGERGVDKKWMVKYDR